MKYDKCWLYSNHTDHNSDIPDTKWGILPEIKDEIRKLLEDNPLIAPKRALIKLNRKLSEERDVERLPTLSQMQNFIKLERYKRGDLFINSGRVFFF